MVFEMENVVYAYNGHPAINNLSLCLEKGKFHAIIGPNGSGKTTLLDLLCGHLLPDVGRILLKGRPLDEFRKKELARTVALVPQEYRVNFPYTAREVISMGRYPHTPRFAAPTIEDKEKVDEVLEACGARDLAGRYMTELSGGEKQRVIFARALAQDTPVLLLDEPCANLDVRHALHLLDLAAIRVKETGATVIAVMHDINLAARYADGFVFMQSGRVVSTGPTMEVLAEPILKQIFGVDARVAYEPVISAPQVVFLR